MTEAKPPKPPSVVIVTWAGGEAFDAGLPGKSQTIRLDGTRATGPSPVDTLLAALGSCSSVDVVEILTKRRTPVEAMSVTVTGQRANAVPAKVTAILLEFRIKGAGVERVHAERAIELAVNKYCSVRDSIDPSIPVTWTLALEG